MRFLRSRLRAFLEYRDLLKLLVARDIKLKYRRSVLGYVWSILNPLLIMVVMVVVFSNVFRYNVPNYPVYLLSGQTLFLFLTESTTLSIGSITGNAAMLKKIRLPKYIFTISKVVSSLVNLLFSLIALVVVMLITRVSITPAFLLFVVPVAELFLFSLGLSLFLAQAAVFFRDIQYIYGVLTTAWLYLTPVFYPIDILPERYRGLIRLGNPMTNYIMQFRAIVLEGRPPEPAAVWGGLAVALLFVMLGAWTFARSQDRFILYV